MEELKKYYFKRLDGDGLSLSARQLLQHAQSKKWGLSKKSIEDFLSGLKHRTPFLRRDRVKHFQTVGAPKSGMFHIDYGEFHKTWAGSNGGNTGFLVAVENFTNRLFVQPCRGKGTSEWLKAVKTFVELSREVRLIFSDRDSVATSTKFRQEIVDKYGIEWNFLKKGNKSYLAERYIGLVKTRLSQTLLHRGGKRWIDLVEPLVTEYNREKIEGTSYSRQSINKTNFLHFLSQLLKIEDPELQFNGAKLGQFEQESWNKKIFQFELGQSVVVSRPANWKFGEDKLSQFGKISMLGGFGTKKCTVSGRQLRMNKAQNRYVAVYSLAEFGPSMHFYSKELKRASSD